MSHTKLFTIPQIVSFPNPMEGNELQKKVMWTFLFRYFPLR